MAASRKQAVSQKQAVWLLLLGSVGFGLIGCNRSVGSRPDSPVAATPSPVLGPPAPLAQPYSTEAQLVAVGDIMMHGSQIQSGYDAATGTYRYDNFFTQVKGILSEGDWVIANLETPLAGANAGYSGYPRFNAPDTLADAIKTAGVNVVSTANNHALDRNEAGVLETLKNVRARGLHPVGTAASPEEARQILILQKDQIDMAILAYTYGTNGIPVPADKDYLVSLIHEPSLVADILRAKRQGADLVTVVLHFGTEYQRQPNSEQKQLVAKLVKAGADIILGSHPHVVQPYEVFESVDQFGNSKKAVAIYSMGNFISNQRGDYKDLGVIFRVKLRKEFPAEVVKITDVEALPTWVHRYSAYGQYQFRVLPLQAILAAQTDPLLGAQTYAQLQGNLEEMNRHLKSLLTARQVAVP
jgi:poly-gamma-glutamate capsule biosynthesis protein CapA/YwtB (metallophosphatase superfamily)